MSGVVEGACIEFMTGAPLDRVTLCKLLQNFLVLEQVLQEYLLQSASPYLLHIKTSVFVSLKVSELIHVPPNVYVLL